MGTLRYEILPEVRVTITEKKATHVTTLHCYKVTMLQSYNVTMLQCRNVTMFHYQMLQCVICLDLENRTWMVV